MMYEEFARRLPNLGISEFPTAEEYTDIIEPVYNYHPVMNVPMPKDKCAEMYAHYGIGIFKALLPEVDEFAEIEHKLAQLRHQYESAKAEFDKLNAEHIRKCQAIRKEWRCA